MVTVFQLPLTYVCKTNQYPSVIIFLKMCIQFFCKNRFFYNIKNIRTILPLKYIVME